MIEVTAIKIAILVCAILVLLADRRRTAKR